MAEKCEADLVDLKNLFDSAAAHAKGIVSTLTKNQMLELYGYYKQATEGPCTREKPKWYEVSEKQKWEAWSTLKSMNTKTAMEKYVALLSHIDPNWMERPEPENRTGWVHHSCMRNDDEVMSDSDKTIFDWVKESNVAMVKAFGGSVQVDEVDEDGLSLLHWAADRGNLEIVKYLVENLKSNVNLRDENGQTPLHFAASCEHTEVAKYLIQAGADAKLKDNDGLTPYDSVS